MSNDPFNLKKFLVENKLTTTSRLAETSRALNERLTTNEEGKKGPHDLIQKYPQLYRAFVAGYVDNAMQSGRGEDEEDLADNARDYFLSLPYDEAIEALQDVIG